MSRINRDVAYWLMGQVRAANAFLSEYLKPLLVNTHQVPESAKNIDDARFALNRIDAQIRAMLPPQIQNRNLPRRPMTPAQEKLHGLLLANERAPLTFKEMAKAMEFKSPSQVHSALAVMVKRGWAYKDNHKYYAWVAE